MSGTPGTPVKPNHLEIMGNGSTARSTNGNFVFPKNCFAFDDPLPHTFLLYFLEIVSEHKLSKLLSLVTIFFVIHVMSHLSALFLKHFFFASALGAFCDERIFRMAGK